MRDLVVQPEAGGVVVPARQRHGDRRDDARREPTRRRKLDSDQLFDQAIDFICGSVLTSCLRLREPASIPPMGQPSARSSMRHARCRSASSNATGRQQQAHALRGQWPHDERMHASFELEPRAVRRRGSAARQGLRRRAGRSRRRRSAPRRARACGAKHIAVGDRRAEHGMFERDAHARLGVERHAPQDPMPLRCSRQHQLAARSRPEQAARRPARPRTAWPSLQRRPFP